MSSHRGSHDNPLSASQGKRLQSDVIREMKRTLTARRFIDIYGPLGAGIETVSFERYGEDKMAEIDLEGGRDAHVIAGQAEKFWRLPLLYKDFQLHWRDVEFSNTTGAPLDVSRAVRAAHFLAHREEDLVYRGNKELGIQGLLNVDGRLTVPLTSWEEHGGAYENFRQATQALLEANHHTPYAAVVSPQRYAMLLKPKKGTLVLEIDAITKLCEDGVYSSPALDGDEALVVSTGPQNFDLAIAEDVNTAYLGPENMNHEFRLYESLVLRIKRASAICVLEAAGQ